MLTISSLYRLKLPNKLSMVVSRPFDCKHPPSKRFYAFPKCPHPAHRERFPNRKEYDDRYA